MMDLDRLAGELRQRTQWQETPMKMNDEDYREIARQAVRHMYVMTGRFAEYDASGVPSLSADEYEYV